MATQSGNLYHLTTHPFSPYQVSHPSQHPHQECHQTSLNITRTRDCSHLVLIVMSDEWLLVVWTMRMANGLIYMTNVHKKRTHTLSIIIFVIFECQLIKDNTELREYSTNIKSKPWIAYIEILSQKINENFWEVSKCLFILNFSGLTPSNIWKIKNLIIINNNTWNSVRYYILSIKTIKTFEKHQTISLICWVTF